jgi:hypothetical protein
MSAPVRIKFETLISGITVLAGVAYSLGWLKTYYYFDAFGIALPALELSVQDYLFESWFVVENLLFFALLLWFVAIRVRWWTITLILAYGLIPIASHYSFLGQGSLLPSLLIDYRHALLKFIPFAVYGIDWFLRRRSYSLASWSWPYTSGSLALFLLVTLAWGISTAKHFGSFDANRCQNAPDRFLPRAEVWLEDESDQGTVTSGAELMYLVYASPSHYFLWQHGDFEFGKQDAAIHILILPKSRVRKIETWKAFQIQPGSMFF